MAGLRDLAIRILISGEDQTGPAIRSINAGTDSIKKGIENLETAARRILGITLFVGLAKEAIDLSDSYRTLQARLKLVTDGTEQFNKAQTELFDIAQRTRSGLSDTYSIYVKLETAVKLLGGTQQQALSTTETLNKAIALTSQGAMQDSAAILQFSQALGSGVLRGEEFNSVMENAPGLANALAIGLDVPITKLRGMAEAGKLTADQLINALGKSAPQIAAQFAVLPVTVSGAMAQVNNALLRYVGQSDVANASTSKLSEILQALAKNFGAVVSGIITLAEAYAARLVVGLISTTKAFFDNAAAAKVAAIAQEQARAAALALLQVKINEAEIAVRLRQQLLFEAEMRVALTAGTNAQAAAVTKLAAAQKALETGQTRLATANTRLAATQEAAAVSSGLLSKALGVLGTATTNIFSAWIAFDIGKTFGEWLRQFEAVRIAGSYVAEAMVMIQTGAQALLNGMSFSERWVQIKQIHDEFNAIRAAEVLGNQAAAMATGTAEQQKTEIIKAAALQQQQAFATTQASVKALTATLDLETKAQSAVIQQGLTDRIAAINAADLSDTAKETQRVAAKLAASQQLLLLDQNAATQKLQLIEQEYAAELASAQGNAVRLAGIETQKREAKLSVYRGIAEFYAGEVAKLSTLFGEETAAFAQSRDALQNLEIANARNLLDIKRQSMTEHEQLDSKQDAFDQDLSDIKRERKKGDAADQNKINALVADAKTYVADLTRVTVDGAISEYKAKENVNALYAVEKQALTDSAAAHERNAAAIKTALASATTELANANAKINEMTTALNKEYLFKVGIDQGSLSAAQAAITDLTKPETKIITIVTQSAGGSGEAAPAFARCGKLPGFGGGDRIAALLEAGEFIVRKEAVQALGTPLLQDYINEGKLPGFAGGGAVDPDKIRREGKQAAEQINWQRVADKLFGLTQGIGNLSNPDSPNASLFRAKDEALISSLTGWIKDMAITEKTPADFSDKAITTLQQAANDKPGDWDFNARMDRAKERIRLLVEDYQIKELQARAVNIPEVASAMPSVNLQQFAGQAANATAQTASSKILQAARKTVNVLFSAPGAEAVSGEFNEGDMDKLFRALKSAGLRTAGGFA